MFSLAGFGTDRLRRKEAMEPAGRKTPNCRAQSPGNRAHGAEDQNRSCSNRRAAKQKKIQPLDLCFFLTSPFREQIRHEKPVSDLRRIEWRPVLYKNACRCPPARRYTMSFESLIATVQRLSASVEALAALGAQLR